MPAVHPGTPDGVPETPLAGLASIEAERRLQRDGPNRLPYPDRRSGLSILRAVTLEPMILLLIAAASVYLLIGDAGEAAILAGSVVLVAALTVFQELRSERALQTLRELSSPRARVRRDGEVRIVAGTDVVVGDLMLLDEGDRIPADGHLLNGQQVIVDESLLTGESVPVRRVAGADAPGDMAIVRASTLVVAGHGCAEVIATGERTAVGGIGATLRAIRPERTPLQREMRHVVAVFATIGAASCVAVVLLHVHRYGEWLPALLAGITLAIANIPEEFPVVLAVFLALGAWRIARHHVLVRRSPAIEALGAVTVLCTDKTGTLTQNRMGIATIVADGLRGAPGSPLPPSLQRVLDVARSASADDPVDPMERAILAAGAAHPPGPCVHEYPLESGLLAVTHVRTWASQPGLDLACKGAPEAVASLCALDDATRNQVAADVAAMAMRGLRVLAVASSRWEGELADLPGSQCGLRFTWLGLIGLADPLRACVPSAVAEASSAGIRVVMLTGDHPETARAIAIEAGLARPDMVMTGADLERLDDDAFAQAAGDIDVFARVRPEHKLRLVRALKAGGQIVAMTGDGINDAPALVAAHVGIAMGARGTDVAREAASIVLLDDDFVSVVAAIRQGRTIYANLVRAVRYILAVHVPITGLALLPLVIGAPLVLLPLHVVVLELIIDPASTLVFEREPAAPDVMRRGPRPPTKRLLDAQTLLGSLAQGLLVFSGVAAAFLWARQHGLTHPQSAALAFIALVAGNVALLVANRASSPHRWRPAANPMFWSVTVFAAVVTFAATAIVPVAAWFGFAAPPLLPATLCAATPPALLWLARSVPGLLERGGQGSRVR